MSKTAAKTTEVTTQAEGLEQRALAVAEDAKAVQAQMAAMGISTQDLTIPILALMQNTSEAVGDGKAKLGDILNGATEEVIGSLDKPVSILPLKMFKTLRVYDCSGSSPKFMREEPLTAANDKQPFEALEENVPVKRYHTFNFFVLLKSDLEKDEAFPFIIRFKSTGMQAGKALATHLFKRIALSKLPYSQFVELNCRKEKKDTNTFAVFGIGKTEPVDQKWFIEAERWLSTLATPSYRVDDREESDEVVSGGAVKEPTVVSAEVVGSEKGPY